MAGTTGLEPATSAVTGQRSDQLSYVPRLFFNNLVIRHIESSGSRLSLFSLFSTISLLWTQFWDSVDTTWTPRWTPKPPPQRQDKVYQMRTRIGVHFPSRRAKVSVHDRHGPACLRLSREKQVKVRVLPKSHAINESVDLAHGIFNREFRKTNQRMT